MDSWRHYHILDAPKEETMTTKIHPETLYYAKRVSQSGHQPVFKKFLPDGETTELSPALSQKLRLHSPDGFQWGYLGSGPAQLALALLLDITSSPETAQDYYQEFKADVVAHWDVEWSITSGDILEWIATRVLENRMNLSSN